MKKKLIACSGAAAVSLILAGCLTMADYNYSRIDSNLKSGKYGDIKTELQENSSFIYSSKDEVLENLDNGVISHFNREFSESNRSLEKAERLMKKYAGEDFAQTITALVTNDNSLNYKGEDFEDLYASIFMSLNYAHLGKNEDAMVEVRRFDNKMKLLKQHYEQEIEKTNQNSQGVSVDKVSIAFSDSALARWLSMIMYRSDGDEGNAEVDQRFIGEAFKKQSGLYNFAVPQSIQDDARIPAKGKGRLNVIAFSGRAPVKKENTIRVPFGLSNWYKLSLPSMDKRKSEITHISLTAVNSVTGETVSTGLEKIESIENIAIDTFQQNYSILLSRALIRSIARTAVSTGLDQVQSDDRIASDFGAQLLISSMQLMTLIYTESVERADVRTSRYFPATASVTGITLDEGHWNVTVNYYNGRKLLFSEAQTLTVKNRGLNLVESACLR